MNIFAGLQRYASRFEVKETRAFNAEEMAEVVSAKVVNSQYGKSICFHMYDGCQKYIPLSRDSVAQIGDVVDVKKAKILILERDGKSIARIEI